MKIQDIKDGQINKYININEGWNFFLGRDLTYANLLKVDKSLWQDIDLPHDWSIFLDFNQESKGRNEAGLLDGGFGYYYKEIFLGNKFSDKQVYINFGGIYMDSSLWVNGKFIASYPFGYNTISYDISDAIRYGKNFIYVKVEHRQPSSRWYSGSGIYRNVKLIVKNKLAFKNYSTVIETEKEEYKNKEIKSLVRYEIENKNDWEAVFRIVGNVLDSKGKIVAKFKTEKHEIKKNKNRKISVKFSVKAPKLWDVERPNLYYLQSGLYVDGKIVDEEFTRFGYRYFDWDSREGFYLNGKYLKFHGVCLHHDNGALGSKFDLEADRRKLSIMKSMGVNAIRTAHNPQSEEFIRLCDEMGLLVIEEAFDTWSGAAKKEYDYNRFFNQKAGHPDAKDDETWAKFDIQNMVKRDINSPSIVMWSIGNEIFELRSSYGLKQGINLIDWIREIDKTRFVTLGEDKFNYSIDRGAHVDLSWKLDAVGLNYAEKNLKALVEKYPTWRLYGSETSSSVKSRGIYFNPQNKDNPITGNIEKSRRNFRLSDYGNDRVGWGRTAIDSWIVDRDSKAYAGQFIWTGFDYIGEPTPWHNEENLGAPSKSSYFGIVDTCGFEKADYYFYQSQWIKKEDRPLVKIIPHWNWEDRQALKLQGTDLRRKDNLIPVRVYSNLSRVELRLNGKTLGEKSFIKKQTDYGFTYLEGEKKDELYLEWLVDFEKGKLEALAKEGKYSAYDYVETSGPPRKLVLVAESNFRLERTSYIEFKIVDKRDNLVFNAENEVFFEAEGCEIIGVDNGDSSSQERYKAYEGGLWKRRAFSGRGILIVRPTAKTIKIQAKSNGLEDGLLISNLEWELEKKEPDLEDFKIENIRIQDFPYKKIEEEKILKAFDSHLYIEDENHLRLKFENLALPLKAKVLYQNGQVKFEDVNWLEKIEKSNSGPDQDEFLVRGWAKGKSASCYIYINKFVKAKNFKIYTRRGIKPILPVSSYAYSNLGEKKEVKISHYEKDKNFDLSDQDFLEDCLITGYLDMGDIRTTIEVKISDRIKDSHNYALHWNGSEIPAAFASYTNKNGPGQDNIAAINNGIVSCDSSFIDRWTNLSAKKRKRDYVGILFGRAGELYKYKIYKLRVAFFEDSRLSSPKKIKIEYFNKDNISVPKTYDRLEGTGHALDRANNWNRVENVRMYRDERFVVYEFDELDTYAVRLNMESKDDFAIGISEIEVYGRVALGPETDKDR